MPHRKLYDQLRPVKHLVVISGLVVLNLFCYWPFFHFPTHQNVFSAPALPLMIRGIELVFGGEHGLIINRLLFLFTVLGPVTWYIFFYNLSSRVITASLSSLLASLPINSLGTTRFEATYLWGDGAHLAALTLTPIVCAALLVFLKKGTFSRGAIAALAMAMVALMSPFGLLTTLIFAVIILFSEMLLGRARLKFARVAFMILAGSGLVSFWYNPHFLYEITDSAQGQQLRATLGNLFPLSFFVIPILATFGFLLFERRQHLQAHFIAIFSSVIFFWISFASSLTGSGLTHVSRYSPELGYSAALGLVLGFNYVFSHIDKFSWLQSRIKKIPVLLLITQRQLLRWVVAFMVVMVVLILSINGLGNTWRLADQSPILGWWSEAETTGIWTLRQSTIWSWIGYLISLATLVTILSLAWRVRKQQQIKPAHEITN